MKKKIACFLCVLSVAGFLTGCGGEFAGISGDGAVSRGAVSGEAVSGQAVSGPAVEDRKLQEAERTGMGSHQFCTDTNLYYNSKGALMQARLDGTHKVCIAEPEEEDTNIFLIHVEEGCLYYGSWNEWHEKGIMYRVPIEKRSDGYDMVRISEKEAILKEQELYVFYADDHYLFYGTGEEQDTIIKYDLQKRTKGTTNLRWDSDTYISRITEGYIAFLEGEAVFSQERDSLQWAKVPGASVKFYTYAKEHTTHNSKAVFFPQYLSKKDDADDFCIKRCDRKRLTDFATWRQLTQAVKTARNADQIDTCHVRWMFWENGRLYIQLQVGWWEKEVYHMEYVILSQKEKKDGTGEGLCYEKKLTEGMQSYVKTRKGMWIDLDTDEETEELPDPEDAMLEHMTMNDAQCVAMINGRVYLSCYDYEKEEGRLACYDLDTAKFQWVGREEALFYELGYDGNIRDFEVVYNTRYQDEEEDINKYTGFSWDPSVDECGAGGFYED